MKKLFNLLALLFLFALPIEGFAQEVSRGYFAVNDCGTIFGPTPFRIVCLQMEDLVSAGRTKGNEYQWTGSAWVQYNGTGGSGGTALLTTFTPAGNLSSTNVQAALEELDTEKLSTTGNAATATLAAQATALAANGTNCTPGQASTGVDAQGNAEGCFTPSGTGAAPALDLGDNGSNESAGLALIATTGDTNSIFTEPLADKLLIDLTKRWPGADTATLATAATALAADGSDCTAGQFPRGVDASGNATNCTALPTTLAGTASQIAVSASTGAITISIPNNPILPGTTSGTFSGNLTGTASNATLAAQATALAADPANCGAGSAPLGIDASGTAQGCFDVATQAELDAHTTSTSAHSATSANTANRIVLRDGSGNFSAGSITANLTGTVTGNASTATLATTATTANALATAGWIPPVVTVATLPASPSNGQEVTVSDGASAGACETGSGTNRTRCQFNSTSGHWEPAIPSAAASSLQTAADVGRRITNAVDPTTAVEVGNGVICTATYTDSSNVAHTDVTDCAGNLVPVEKITKAYANKIVDVQDSSGTSVFTVTDTSGVGAITAAKGLAGGFSIPYTGSGAAGAIQDADDFPKIARIPYGQTITKICGTTDTGTTTFNLQRNDGSPVNIASSNIIAATSEVCTTTFTSGENVLSEGHYIDLVIVTGATTGTPTKLTIGVNTTRN